MKIQRVYVDTSVIGGCFDPEFARWSKGLMRDFEDGTFEPVLSEVLIAELEEAPEPIRELRDQLLLLRAEVVTITETAIELADEYQARKILTPSFYADGLHVALAAVAETDLLVSWNFKHIVRFDKIRLFNAVNAGFGYKPLSIHSPREVTTYGDPED